MSHDLWEIVYLDFTRRVTEEESRELALAVIEMHYKDLKRKKLKTDFWKGEIYTDGKYGNLGCFAGKIYRGELENYKGLEVKMSFILTKKIDQELN